MSLIWKITLFYLLTAVLVFGLGGLMTYEVVKREIKKETDYALRHHLREIVENIEEDLPLELLRRSKVEIEALPPGLAQDTTYYFSDTLAAHSYLKGVMEPHRKLKVVKHIAGQDYQIAITDVLIERDDIYDVVVAIMWRLFLLLGLSMIVASFFITHWLLTPFRGILNSIRGFKLKQKESIPLPATSTREFRQLSVFITVMTEQARRDFRAVKEFSENASHEMQTPLAIARGKLELLQDTEGLDQEQSRLIEDAQQALRRLSKLGNALLLLTKIDNQEFKDQKPIDFSAVVQNCLDNFEELALLRGLPLERDVQAKVQMAIDPTLADVLVGNLVRNAIRHNLPDGQIYVSLNEQRLLVRNTGPEPEVPTESLFDRFRRSSHTPNSLGLGLAIVKKICDANQLGVSYRYGSGWHEVVVGLGKFKM